MEIVEHVVGPEVPPQLLYQRQDDVPIVESGQGCQKAVEDVLKLFTGIKDVDLLEKMHFGLVAFAPSLGWQQNEENIVEG